MELDYDPIKDAKNRVKHGVSLANAAQLEWDSALIWEDERFAYGEVRMVGLGYIGLRLYNVVYVDRAEVRRIISLRKANPGEYRIYANA